MSGAKEGMRGDGWFLERKAYGRRVADDDEADWSSDYKGEG